MDVLQGFGNVGAWAAEIYQEQGGIVTTVCDAEGALHNPDGLDIKALREHYSEGKLNEFSGGASTLVGLVLSRHLKRHSSKRRIRVIPSVFRMSSFGLLCTCVTNMNVIVKKVSPIFKVQCASGVPRVSHT